MNIEKKRQRVNQSSMMSPTRDVKPPQINNRQKWESLQKKISALRVENDELKRTLLYEWVNLIVKDWFRYYFYQNSLLTSLVKFYKQIQIIQSASDLLNIFKNTENIKWINTEWF